MNWIKNNKKKFAAICVTIIAVVCFATNYCSHENYHAVCDIEPTCTNGGEYHNVCNNCGKTLDNFIGEPNGHEYGEWEITREATCSEAGEKVKTCNICGWEYKETIAIEEHTYDNGVITKSATCGDEGVKTFTCTDCGHTKTESIAKAGDHHYNNGEVTKQPTRDECGTKTYTCTVCGDTKTESIDKIDAFIGSWEANNGYGYSVYLEVSANGTCVMYDNEDLYCKMNWVNNDGTYTIGDSSLTMSFSIYHDGFTLDADGTSIPFERN